MTKSSEVDERTPPEYTITALESALHVLNAVAENPGLRTGQLAGLTGLTKSKVFRILRTLEAFDYVSLGADHASSLGASAFLLGKRAEQQWSLARAATPVLDELAERTRENVHLVVRQGLHSQVVDVRLSPQPVRMYAQVGRIGPLHAGGTPKVLLAYAPESVVERVLSAPLDHYTDATIQDPHALRSLLGSIRVDGYHIGISDLDEDTFSVAAPVRDHSGDVVAALSVAGPVMRLDDGNRSVYVRLVVDYADQISQALGYRVGMPLGT